MRMTELTDWTDRAHVLSLPLRVPFRGVTTREVMLFEPGSPNSRWSEWAPFVEYKPEEAARWLRAAVTYADAPPAAEPMPVEVNATIPAVDVAADPEIIDRLMSRYHGCTTVKIKVAEAGQSIDADLARVRAVRAWFERNAGPDGPAATAQPMIRMDANGGWNIDEALTVIQTVAAEGPIDYAEQPCATIGELAEVRSQLMRRGVFARIAADESIRKTGDPLAAVREVVDARACDVAVVKVPPLGGVDRLLEIAADVARRGVALTVSSALDTAVGLGAGLEAAAALTSYIDSGDDEGVVVQPQAAGLATGTLFVQDVAERPIVDGSICSVAVAPDPAVLEEFRAAPERRDWWLGRLKTCQDVLGAV